MQPVDLHIHSYYSDGTCSPAGLVQKAVEKGLSAIALTDHDTVEGVQEALYAARGTSVEVIPGIEISTSYKNFDLHITGLYIAHDDPDLLAITGQFADEREDRNRKMCHLLNIHGIPVSYDELKKFFSMGVLTRAHFGRYLLEHGCVSSVSEAFDRYIGEEGPCYVPRSMITPEEAVAMIHRFHGVAVMAHPLKYHLPKEELEQLIRRLKKAGLDGIEVLYSTHTSEETDRLFSLARKYDLLPGGGSDFHGTNKPGLDMGTGYGELYIPDEYLLAFKHRLYHTTPETKIFFSDFDNTLSDSAKQLQPAVREALQKWSDAGHRFVLSSGRTLSSLLQVIRELDLQFPHMLLCGSDGAEIYDTDTERYLAFDGVSLDLVPELEALADDIGVYCQCYTRDSIVTRKMSRELEHYLQFVPLPVIFTDAFSNALSLPPSKFLALAFENKERLLRLKNAVDTKYAGSLSCVSSGDTRMEIFSAYCGKGASLLWLCRRLGIDPSRSVAAGDAENDFSMLKAAGFGIAMCNGVQEDPRLLDAADAVTETDNDHEGLAPLLLSQL